MSYTVRYSRTALRNLKSLEHIVARRVLSKVEFFLAQEDPLYFAIKMKDPSLGSYRFRVGDYRIIFDIERGMSVNTLYILRVAHRRDVYEN